MTTWDIIKNHLNKLGRHETVTRQRLITKVIDSTISPVSESTIDGYRRLLTRAGYLEHLNTGVYLIVKKPERYLTLTMCKHRANNT